jgi:hypothetical protein
MAGSMLPQDASRMLLLQTLHSKLTIEINK